MQYFTQEIDQTVLAGMSSHSDDPILFAPECANPNLGFGSQNSFTDLVEL
jgi:hypothetical protein